MTFCLGFGKIRSINLKPGYGFVDFEDVRDARDAVQVISSSENILIESFEPNTKF